VKPVEDVAAFKLRAEEWLADRKPRRVSVVDAPMVWGEGEFDVTVFHDRSLDDERRYLSAYVDWIAERSAAGLWGITWPTEFGGAGLTKAHERAYIDVEADFDVPNDHELISVTCKLIAPAIERFGTQEQKERFVVDFLTAKQFCCQLFSEPGAGSDLAGLSCRAIADGDEWVLDGQKVWTSNAHITAWGFAICRTDPTVPKHAGLTAFLVPLDSPGIEIRPIKQMNGGASFNEVFFSGTRIPDSLRIGQIGEGWKVAVTILGYERESSGSSGRRGGTFDDLLLLARHLGRTNDPLIRQGLAKAYSVQQARGWVRDRAAAGAKRTGTVGPEGSIGKLLWSDSMRQISDVASELLGASLTADTAEWGTFQWNQHVLGAPGYRIAGGSDEIQRNIIGERVLGLPSEPRVDRDVPFNQIGSTR
jgi:alkylation response protein AidB-like acyl-CoA dehydrogenase